jgi:hypothetical protein
VKKCQFQFRQGLLCLKNCATEIIIKAIFKNFGLWSGFIYLILENKFSRVSWVKRPKQT